MDESTVADSEAGAQPVSVPKHLRSSSWATGKQLITIMLTVKAPEGLEPFIGAFVAPDNRRMVVGGFDDLDGTDGLSMRVVCGRSPRASLYVIGRYSWALMGVEPRYPVSHDRQALPASRLTGASISFCNCGDEASCQRRLAQEAMARAAWDRVNEEHSYLAMQHFDNIPPTDPRDDRVARIVNKSEIREYLGVDRRVRRNSRAQT